MKYVCEVCGIEAELTEAEAYESGWDYPPFIGAWGIVSPRTCPNCPMTETAWWYLIKNGGEDVPEKHRKTIERIIIEQPEDRA